MKKMLTLIVLSAAVAVVNAAPVTGTFTTPEDFAAGQWSEELIGGVEGQAGNVLEGDNTVYDNGDVLTPATWTLASAVLTGTPTLVGSGSDFDTYETFYNNGVLTLMDGGPWFSAGDAAYVVNLDPLKVISNKYDDDTLSWMMTGTGNIDGYAGYTVNISANYSRATPGVFTTGNAQVMYGPISSVTLEVVPEPATIAMLGLGCVLLRRKNK